MLATIMEGHFVTVTIGKHWQWAIGTTLTANIVAFVRVFWWLNKHYRKYKYDFVSLLKEHNALVEYHNQNNPDDQIDFAYRSSSEFAHEYYRDRERRKTREYSKHHLNDRITNRRSHNVTDVD